MSHRRAKALRKLMNDMRPEHLKYSASKVHKIPRSYKWYTTGTEERVDLEGNIVQFEVAHIRNELGSPRELYQRAKKYARRRQHLS